MQVTGSIARKGFTLIELLVVVAIIGLLVSILLPSLKQARDQGRQVVCMSNLRSQGQAAHQYANDYNDLMLAGLQSNAPPEYLGNPNRLVTLFRYGLAAQMWLPYLNYEIPLEKVTGPQEIERRRWQNLFAFGNETEYRSTEPWQGRMGDAFDSISVYQCPSFPPTLFRDSSRVIESELDYLTNAMPYPFTDRNVANESDLRLNRNEADEAAGVPIGAANYFDRRRLSSLKYSSDIMHVGEIDEALVVRDIQWNNGNGEPRNSFIFHAIFAGAHIPRAYAPRIDNDYDDGEDGRKRHPGGTTLLFFDGRADVFGYDRLDPGEEFPFAIRLRWFSDPTKLSPQWH